MKKYQILINYDTGDSFHNEYGLETILELTWGDLDVAKENLKRIEKHYKWHKEKDSWSYGVSKDVINEWKSRIVDFTDNEYEHCLNLVTNDGKPFKMSCFWVGYFESLNFAKIIIKEDEDLIFNAKQCW